MLRRDRRILFVHIPRTGGTSVEHALFPRHAFSDEPDYERLYGWEDRLGWLNHLTVNEALSLFDRNCPAFDRCVAVVRNPWDRLVSEYKWKFSDAPPPVSFDAFVTGLHTGRAESACAFYRSPRAFFQHARPQSEYLRKDGRDKVLRFEDPGWPAKLASTVGLEPAAIGWLNASDRGPYQAYYTDRTRDLVAQIYKGDIERFGYKFAQGKAGVGKGL